MKMYLKIQDVFTRLNEFYQTCQVVRQSFSKIDIWNCSKVPSSCYQINTVLSLQVSQILHVKSEHVRDTGTLSGETTVPFAIFATLLNRGQLLTERICSIEEQIHSVKSRHSLDIFYHLWGYD